MNFLYIGQYSEGTTSKMRADLLKQLLPGAQFQVIDTHIPFFEINPVVRSIGFRFKKGPLISKVNRYILHALKQESYDCIWVDKAIFVTAKTTQLLKRRTKKLIHFTPDPAFTFHQSKHFLASISTYDYAVTTKTFELDHYYKVLPKEKVTYVTQGFDPKVHKPYFDFEEKIPGVSFLGHCEKEREAIVETLINKNIRVALAGKYWDKFAEKNKQNKNLIYLGDGVYGDDYAKTISKYYFSLGLISKWIKEQHTTRTFEIPACGSALVTERNPEIEGFYKENEVIFFTNINELVTKILYYLNNVSYLKAIIKSGTKRVHEGGFDYTSILKNILKQAGINS